MALLEYSGVENWPSPAKAFTVPVMLKNISELMWRTPVSTGYAYAQEENILVKERKIARVRQHSSGGATGAAGMAVDDPSFIFNLQVEDKRTDRCFVPRPGKVLKSGVHCSRWLYNWPGPGGRNHAVPSHWSGKGSHLKKYPQYRCQRFCRKFETCGGTVIFEI